MIMYFCTELLVVKFLYMVFRENLEMFDIDFSLLQNMVQTIINLMNINSHSHVKFMNDHSSNSVSIITNKLSSNLPLILL